MAQQCICQANTRFELFDLIDTRLTWLKGIAALLASQGEISAASSYPEAESIGTIGWLMEHLIGEARAASDKLCDILPKEEIPC